MNRLVSWNVTKVLTQTLLRGPVVRNHLIFSGRSCWTLLVLFDSGDLYCSAGHGRFTGPGRMVDGWGYDNPSLPTQKAFVCLRSFLWLLYHGESPLNHHLGEYFSHFPGILK